MVHSPNLLLVYVLARSSGKNAERVARHIFQICFSLAFWHGPVAKILQGRGWAARGAQKSLHRPRPAMHGANSI